MGLQIQTTSHVLFWVCPETQKHNNIMFDSSAEILCLSCFVASFADNIYYQLSLVYCQRQKMSQMQVVEGTIYSQ
jgi:hypothetical protein